MHRYACVSDRTPGGALGKRFPALVIHWIRAHQSPASQKPTGVHPLLFALAYVIFPSQQTNSVRYLGAFRLNREVGISAFRELERPLMSSDNDARKLLLAIRA